MLYPWLPAKWAMGEGSVLARCNRNCGFHGLDGRKTMNILERQAGHILVSLVLLVLGAVLWKLGVPKAEEILPFTLGVLARSMMTGEQK
jgi:hypothetical protein